LKKAAMLWACGEEFLLMFFAKEGIKVGKGEEALFYYITRRMQTMLIAIISFKGKTP